MTFLFLDYATRELREMDAPTPVHEDLIAFWFGHPNATYIVRGKPEGNYILRIER